MSEKEKEKEQGKEREKKESEVETIAFGVEQYAADSVSMNTERPQKKQ